MYKANAFDGNDEKYKNRLDMASTKNGILTHGVLVG
jgi:hypothetical protein